jgi:U3 small nucleolar RNA-associated protein 23
MRHGRAKAARKTLQFYALNAGVQSPYKVILDGNFLVAAIRQKVPVHERLGKTLQKTDFTFYVTRSALDELASLPGDLFQQARQFGLDECEIIERNAIPGKMKEKKDAGDEKDHSKEGGSSSSSLGEPGDDIRHLVTDGNNRRGYLIGTQDEALSDALRELPYVPQLRLSRGVLLLEAPSAASRRQATSQERNKMVSGGGLVTKEEKEMVAAVREKDRAARKRKAEEARKAAAAGGAGHNDYDRRMKKKAKGPNPLSCRKSSKGSGGGGGEGEEKKKRRRKGKSSGSAK